mmetsp:Transcript_4433/g.8070  ORF Transcript_4433/g.8070 Transcript_4433/m.8070 type:complete len:363 (-) Transcript_4433:272-1360(-)
MHLPQHPGPTKANHPPRTMNFLKITLGVNLALCFVLLWHMLDKGQHAVGSAVVGARQTNVATFSRMRSPVLSSFKRMPKRSVKRYDAIKGTHMGQPGGLETVKLTHPSGSEATIYKWGAAATSFKDSSGTEWLAVRPDAKFDGSKAISGGIPHCFPQFGPGVLPQHGFARDSLWNLVKAEGSSATFELTDSPKTRQIWDYPFRALYTVSLDGDVLKTNLQVVNTGDKPFEFTGALHSYFDVSNIDDIQIVGPFKGKGILDRMQDPAKVITADSDVVKITTETDQVVEGVVGTVKIEDKGKGKSLLIKSTEGWQDTVLWNPYGNSNMGYEKFVCVEAAAAMKPVEVAPGQAWTANMDLIPSAL